MKRKALCGAVPPAVLLLLLFTLTACQTTDHIADADALRQAVATGSGIVRLARGVIDIYEPIEVPSSAQDLEIIGDPSGTTLRVSPQFEGHAVLVFRSASKITLSGRTIRSGVGSDSRQWAR